MAGGRQQPQGAGLGAAHDALPGGGEVVVAGEVQPAVDEVEGELGREVAALAPGKGGGGVGGDADLAGGAERGVAGEGDDVGRGGVGEEVGVEAGERGVGQEDEGERAGRAAAGVDSLPVLQSVLG